MQLPEPIILQHEDILVVRDDLLPGGTKRRAIHTLFDDAHEEFIYASPAQGAAQIALALAAADYGKRATIFVAQRKTLHPFTQQAADAGALIMQVPMGFLSNVTARAREYAERTPSAALLPFGLDDERMIEGIADVARCLPVQPHEVWSITSSGVLTRGLQIAWPCATFYGVRVGAEPNAGRCTTVYVAPERFEQNAKILPPFPSSINYDAKAWRFIKEHATPGSLFWNVA
jgi:hypothetical protein